MRTADLDETTNALLLPTVLQKHCQTPHLFWLLNPKTLKLARFKPPTRSNKRSPNSILKLSIETPLEPFTMGEWKCPYLLLMLSTESADKWYLVLSAPGCTCSCGTNCGCPSGQCSCTCTSLNLILTASGSDENTENPHNMGGVKIEEGRANVLSKPNGFSM